MVFYLNLLRYPILAVSLGSSAVIPLVYFSFPQFIKKEVERKTKTPQIENTLLSIHPDNEYKKELTKDRRELEIASSITDLSIEKDQTSPIRNSLKNLKVQKHFTNESKILPNNHQDLLSIERSQIYRDFLGSLWNILRSSLWMDEKFGTPWITHIFPSFPKRRNLLIDANRRGGGEVGNLISEFLEVEINSEDIAGMKVDAGGGRKSESEKK